MIYLDKFFDACIIAIDTVKGVSMPNYPTTAEIVRAARLYGDVFTAASATGVIPRSRALIANSGDIYVQSHWR